MFTNPGLVKTVVEQKEEQVFAEGLFYFYLENSLISKTNSDENSHNIFIKKSVHIHNLIGVFKVWGTHVA